MQPPRPNIGLGRLRQMPASARRLIMHSASRDAVALASGSVAAQAIFFVVAPIFLRLYSPASYGLYTTAYSIIGMLSIFVSWNIERLVVVVAADAAAVRLMAALLFFCGLTCVLLLILGLLAEVLVHVTHMSLPQGYGMAWLAPLSLPLLVGASGMRSYSVRRRLFGSVARAQLLRAVLFAAGATGTALLFVRPSDDGASVLLAWQVAGDGGSLLVLCHANRGELRQILRRARVGPVISILRSNRGMLGALGVSQVLDTAVQRIPIATVALAFGPTAAGWFSLANSFSSLPHLIAGAAISDVMNQRLSRLYAEGRPISRLVLRISLGMAAIGIIPYIVLGAAAPSILPMVIGPSWDGAGHSLQILCATGYTFFIAGPAGYVIIIIQARSYMISWQVGRLIGLGVLTVLAMQGVVSYEGWLVCYAAGLSCFYLLEPAMGFLISRAEEASCQQTATER